MSPRSLYFIPDISGFTSFVKNVEVEHSKHIVSELLQLIIDSDGLKMEVAEVEGDAIFFYKKENLPTPDDIIKQIEKTYVRFHEHLKLYETKRICDCGACSSAAELSLKFIVHEGDVNTITVNGKEKPFGEDVIRVHRLLKNSIDTNEYALFTDNILGGASALKEGEWSKVKEGEDDYEELGTVPYKSIGLSFLRDLVNPPIQLNYDALSLPAFNLAIDIKGGRQEVFELLINMNHRTSWNKSAPELKFDKDSINRVGAKHMCVIGSREIEFETVTNDFGKDAMVFGEKSSELPFVKEGTTYYILHGNSTQTNLRVEFHYKSSFFLDWLFKLVLLGNLKKGAQGSLKLIKKIIEEKTLGV